MIEQLHLASGPVLVDPGAPVVLARLAPGGDRRRLLQWRAMRWHAVTGSSNLELVLNCNIPGLEYLSGPLFYTHPTTPDQEIDLFATSPGDAGGELTVTSFAGSQKTVGVILKGFYERDVTPWERAPLETSAPYVRDSGDALITIDTTPRIAVRLPAGSGGRGIRLYDLELASVAPGTVRIVPQGIEGFGGEMLAHAILNPGARFAIYGWIPAGKEGVLLATRTTGSASYRVNVYGWTVP